MIIKKFAMYIINVCILNKKIGYIRKKKFASFGENSYIAKPFILKNEEKIHIGHNVRIEKNIRMEIYDNQEQPITSITIDDNTEVMYNVSILAGADVKIGKNVLIASNVLITSENHGINPEASESYVNQPLNMKPVSIGDNVWIGEKSIILPGVEIGRGSVVAAGSIVTKNVAPFTIVAGNPAIVKKKYDFEKHMWVSNFNLS